MQSTRNQARLHLPLTGKAMHSFVNTEPARLYPLLAAPGSPAAAGWYGEERLVRYEGAVLVAENAGFRRYVYGLNCIVRASDGSLQVIDPEHATFGLAGLDVRLASKRQRRNLVERIYVMPEARRQGIATSLVLLAKQDMPDLSLDGKLTADGAALFGYPFKH
ncbi:GNAT family N-acetyltransferase [Chitinimonas naiadis]